MEKQEKALDKMAKSGDVRTVLSNIKHQDTNATKPAKA